MSPDLNKNKLHLEQVGEMRFRQSEHTCKHAWVVSGIQAGVGGPPSASDSQPDPVHA